jgi:hypothetical protein
MANVSNYLNDPQQFLDIFWEDFEKEYQAVFDRPKGTDEKRPSDEMMLNMLKTTYPTAFESVMEKQKIVHSILVRLSNKPNIGLEEIQNCSRRNNVWLYLHNEPLSVKTDDRVYLYFQYSITGYLFYEKYELKSSDDGLTKYAFKLKGPFTNCLKPINIDLSKGRYPWMYVPTLLLKHPEVTWDMLR